ncbi:hypothetical protein NL676_010611 [Syzygium grande]|nr:hypothetical protein NL676_010611 [Syzygium grande]
MPEVRLKTVAVSIALYVSALEWVCTMSTAVPFHLNRVLVSRSTPEGGLPSRVGTSPIRWTPSPSSGLGQSAKSIAGHRGGDLGDGHLPPLAGWRCETKAGVWGFE